MAHSGGRRPYRTRKAATTQSYAIRTSGVALDHGNAVWLCAREFEHMAEAPLMAVRKRHVSTGNADFAVSNGVLDDDGGRLCSTRKLSNLVRFFP